MFRKYPPPAPEADAAADNLKPRWPLRRQLLLWMVLAVTVPTAVCGFWNHRIASAALESAGFESITTLTRTTAGAIADPLARKDLPQVQAVLETLMRDERVAAVLLDDPKREPLYERTLDADALTVLDKRDETVEAGRPQAVVLGGQRGKEARIHTLTLPVWREAVLDASAPQASPQRRREAIPDASVAEPPSASAWGRGG